MNQRIKTLLIPNATELWSAGAVLAWGAWTCLRHDHSLSIASVKQIAFLECVAAVLGCVSLFGAFASYRRRAKKRRTKIPLEQNQSAK